MAAFEMAERTPDLRAIVQSMILNSSVSQTARELGVSRTTVREIAREERGVSPLMQDRISGYWDYNKGTQNRELYNGIDALTRLPKSQVQELVRTKDKTVWEHEKERAAQAYRKNWRYYRKKGGKFSVFSP